MIGRHSKRHRLLHARTREGGVLEIGYLVTLRSPDDAPRLTDALGQTEGVEQVALYFDEERPL